MQFLLQAPSPETFEYTLVLSGYISARKAAGYLLKVVCVQTGSRPDPASSKILPLSYFLVMMGYELHVSCRSN
jgi:hypothetical protein